MMLTFLFIFKPWTEVYFGSIGTVNNYSYVNLMVLDVWVDLIHQLYFKQYEKMFLKATCPMDNHLSDLKKS